MGCHSFTNAEGTVQGHLCLMNIYRYEGLVFEYHNYLGPTQLKSDMSEPRKNISKNFWDVVSNFEKLSKTEREKYLIYG